MSEPLELECCVVDLQRQEVRRGEEVIGLTRKEVALLQYLQARPGVPVSREELHQEVWGYAEGVVSRAVDYAVARLRKKIERQPKQPRHLCASRQQGYSLHLLEKPTGVDPARVKPQDLPQPFGRYQLQRLLGEGGMARVFLAELQGPLNFTKAVALKVIKPSRTGEVDGLQRSLFLKEARLGGVLRHPNVVDVYELGEEQGTLFLAMEWVSGVTLRQAIDQEGGMSASALLHVGISVCAGLEAAHNLTVQGAHAGLVHRDVKPSNVLIGEAGVVKLADFGVCSLGGCIF